MRWRKTDFKTWKEIRKALPAKIRLMSPGETRWFDLEQDFDSDKTFGLVLGYDPEGELAIKLAYETNDSYCHDYDMDWLLPITDDDGTCWDTEIRISTEDADRPEFLDHTIDWFKEQWEKMKEFFKKKSSHTMTQTNFEEIRKAIKETVRNLNNLDEGVIRRFDIPQDFDSNADYAVVLSYDKHNNLSLDLVREAHEGTPVETDWSPGSGVKWNGSGFPEEEFDESITWIEKCWKDWVKGFPAWWGAKTYKPEPIDTSGVELPEEITDLTEKLAKSTHDIWAQNRLDQGWSYGKYRDDEEKLHPCLAPYETLPEEEKKYDRDTAMETLKAIYALGYRITK